MPQNTPHIDALLTPGEVATMFRVDAKTVSRWAKLGKIPFVWTLGGHRRYPEKAVRELLARNMTQRKDDTAASQTDVALEAHVGPDAGKAGPDQLSEPQPHQL